MSSAFVALKLSPLPLAGTLCPFLPILLIPPLSCVRHLDSPYRYIPSFRRRHHSFLHLLSRHVHHCMIARVDYIALDSHIGHYCTHRL